MELRRKVIGVPLEKAMPSDDGALLVKGKFTSDQKDEAGDIITRSATEKALPKYKRWGNIRRMHLPEPVGKVTRMGVDDGLDWNEVEIKVIDPKAKFEVENGLLQALSVGILVNMDNIERLSDGGWVINEYQMAEISLVDHPANYDAELTLNLSMDEALRTQIREQGIVPVLRSMGAAPVQKGALMEEQEITPEVEKAVDQPVAEEAVVEDAIIEETKDIVEDAAPAEEQPVVEEQPAEAVAAVEPSLEDTLIEVFNRLDSVLTALEKKVDALAPKPEPEPVVKSIEAKDNGGDDRVAQLSAEVAELKALVAAMSAPTERKGAMPTEEPAVEKVAEEPVVEQKAVSLKDALRKHFETRHK